MVKNVIIVHGCNEKDKENIIKYNLPSQNLRHWIPWLKRELEKRGFEVFNPLMPKNWEPSYEEWKKEFERISLNEETIFVGHSSGGGFLVRWLGETKRKVKKLILVAPAIVHDRWIHPEKLLKFDINKNIKDNVGDIVIFVSEDDSRGIREAVNIFSNKLNVKPIWLKNKGHFIFTEMGTEEFPELLEEVLK
jgi:predicted alpha/beta hydrolase family esterase